MPATEFLAMTSNCFRMALADVLLAWARLHVKDSFVLLIRAKYIVTMVPGDPPIRDGAVRIEDGKIVAADRAPNMKVDPDEPTFFLPNAVLLPGMVNAHTHLELTHLHGRIGNTPRMLDWFKKLIHLLREDQAGPPTPEGVALGIRMSLAAGVTCVGDACRLNLHGEQMPNAPIRRVCFIEAAGLGEHGRKAADGLEPRLNAYPLDPLTTLGVTPHAPYSTSKELYRHCIELSRRRGLLCSTHFAETFEELQLLRDGTGDFIEFHRMTGRPTDELDPYHQTAVEFAREAGLLDSDVPALLAHGNYLAEEDIAELVSTNCSIAFCPRSHRYFGHTHHPWQQMIAAGLNVCLGTDSLASNASLGILDELQYLRRRNPEVPAVTLWRMATINGAKALGLAETIGTIAPGKQADLVALTLPYPSWDSPLADVLDRGTEVASLWIAGQRIDPAKLLHED